MGDLRFTIQLQSDVLFPPAALDNFVATPFSAAIIDLGWIDPNMDSIEYALDYDTDPLYGSATSVVVSATPGAGGTTSIGGLAAATTYYFRIRVKGPGGWSDYAHDSAATL